ncbi:hypothetical protein HYPSUDRAFT_147866, partial [Hypholoma sublateritium FD-334 SS-4]
PVPPLCEHKNCENCYVGYPQSRFPNWSHPQVVKSRIYHAIHEYNRHKPCNLYRLDVANDGVFSNPGPLVAAYGHDSAVWEQFKHDKRPTGTRVRAMFIENLSGPVLQMLGSKYNIEPSFWSSSLGWIPSRYQEEVQPGLGDHITITLTFLRSMSNYHATRHLSAWDESTGSAEQVSQHIDPHSPLSLYSNARLLVLDLLAIHFVRNKNGSTIISFHPSKSMPTTTATFLKDRIRAVGQSVHWQSIFQRSSDPTFILLPYIWHAMYAWDEALEHLYDHICALEMRVISAAEIPLTREMHVIRAHQLHYSALLSDLNKHIVFVRDTYNPTIDDAAQADRRFSKALMKRECGNLLTETKRLQDELQTQQQRLTNLMDLVRTPVSSFSNDFMSYTMKQIAYLTMVFLPASFIAGVFGMNIGEFNPGSLGSLPVYISISIPLTVVTVWIIIAFQSRDILPPNTSFFMRLLWPMYLARKLLRRMRERSEYHISVSAV